MTLQAGNQAIFESNVGIGTSSPSKKLSIKSDGGGSQLGIDIHNEGTATGDDAVISFETQGSREFTMGLDRSATSFVIAESSTLGSNQRLVIDNSGNLLVGKTASSFNTAGIQLQSNGELYATRAGGTVVSINRKTDDGAIVNFAKDGSTVGSISSRSGAVLTMILDPRTGGRGLSAGTDSIVPTDKDGTLSNGATDIGEQNFKFRDLYLSGGAYLGGTGSANHLDDYEEGTWTPALEASTTNPTPTAVTVNNATYTKVGRMVHVQAYITVNLTSIGSGGAQITGLPFTVGTGYAPVLFTHGNLILSSGGYFNNGSTKIIAITNNSTSSIGYAGTGTKLLMISGTYEVA